MKALRSTLVMAAMALSLGGFPPQAQAGTALDIHGSAYVLFPDPNSIGVSSFTIECWFRLEGAGIGASTGTGGVVAIPLVTRGRSEADGDRRDMNYFLGIRASDNVLAADFEDSATGANHPIVGTTAIVSGVWYHAAATFGDSTLRLYLNGVRQAEITVAQTPRLDSIQRAAIATALDSKSVASGSFDGVIDEVRVWNYARTEAEISTSMNTEIASAPGLVARWGLDEESGTSVADTSGRGVIGTIVGADHAWVAGAPTLATNQPPEQPALNAPADGAVGVVASPTLDVTVNDPDSNSLTVTFYGRQAAAPVPGFTIMTLPDTQYYSQSYPATFIAQTQWIVNTRAALNTVFVAHLGDIVQSRDSSEQEWINADNALSLFDGVLPYGVTPGNHDMDLNGVAVFFDKYFPETRYTPYPWYGGYFRKNKNNYELFSAGGMDFIVIHLEYDMPGDAVTWVGMVLDAYPNRRAIIVTHAFLDPSGNRPMSPVGRPNGTSAEAVWQNLIRSRCNVFLVLNGHYRGESRLTSTNNCGQPVHQVLQDYQGRTNGGDGWLRYFTFEPAENTIDAYTYSPTLIQFETDADSQFTLDYQMNPFGVVATGTGVAPGSSATAEWSSLSYSTRYEWYVAVSDGASTTIGPRWSFTTKELCVDPEPFDLTCDGVDDDCDGQTDEDYVSVPTTCGVGVCASTGTTSCVAGSFHDSCTPGTPSAEICNGIDDDCDGSTDEGLGSTACGVGACQRTVQNCVGGAPQTCTPGTATGEVCNGIDDDCDGSTDEGLGSTACGVGACQRTVQNCVDGVLQTCTPGQPSTEICDGVDNDCDGLVDGPDSDHDGEGDACNLTITFPLVAADVSCSGPPPTIAWTPGVYDRFKVFMSWVPALPPSKQVTSGDTFLKTNSWRVPVRKWAKVCNKANPNIYIKVFGKKRRAAVREFSEAVVLQVR